jgi:hypothetical protein
MRIAIGAKQNTKAWTVLRTEGIKQSSGKKTKSQELLKLWTSSRTD